MKTPLIGMTLDQLRGVAAETGLRPFAAGQMARWLYQKRVTDIGAMTDIPAAGVSSSAAAANAASRAFVRLRFFMGYISFFYFPKHVAFMLS